MCKCPVFIIDRTHREQVGHHLQYNTFFLKALDDNGQDSFLVNHTEDIWRQNLIRGEDFNVWAKKKAELTNLEISSVLEIALTHNISKFHLFFTWTRHFLARDLELWQDALNGLSYSIEGLGPSSNWLRGLPGWEREFKHVSSFVNSCKNTRYLSWDRKLLDLEDGRFGQLPDYAERVSTLRGHELNERASIGFFGTGSFDRGFSTFLVMSVLNPKIDFRFYGRDVNWTRLIKIDLGWGKLSAVVSRALSLLMAPCFFGISRMPNFEINIGYPDLGTLISRMQSCHAVFYESKNRGESSGLVMHALAAKVPVVYKGRNSQIVDWLDENCAYARLTFWDYLCSKRFQNKVSWILNVETPETPTWSDFKNVFLAFNCTEYS